MLLLVCWFTTRNTSAEVKIPTAPSQTSLFWRKLEIVFSQEIFDENSFIDYSFFILSMGSICKSFALALILIMTISSLSLLIIKPANAQSIPKPSVPDFTVKFIPKSYTVTTTDPYTGKSTTQQNDNSTIQISITNQQYTYSNGSTFYLYYNIRTKGHFIQNWTELYPTYPLWANAQAYDSPNYKIDGIPYIALTAEDPENSYFGLPQTQTVYTIISVPKPAPSGQVDFQVKAMVGKNSTFFDPTNNIVYDPAGGGVDRPAVGYVTSSDWSNTQTISITDTSASPSPTPTIPEFPALAIMLLLIVIVSAGLLVYHKQYKR